MVLHKLPKGLGNDQGALRFPVQNAVGKFTLLPVNYVHSSFSADRDNPISCSNTLKLTHSFQQIENEMRPQSGSIRQISQRNCETDS